MDYVSTISKTDLARKTREVFHSVQHGQAVIVENHGQPEAAILEIADYYILLAAARFQTQPPQIASEEGLSDDVIEKLTAQERYDLVIAHYLVGSISISRAAELLGLPWLDLRSRLHRTGLPVRIGPENIDDLRAEMDALTKWQNKNSKGS
jgi:predicted HTH domain antitoxin/antitoxin (DNA-binding transcriptional repressor) of toxin-antitoxin stability system